jgi:hypothetical protein
MSDQFDSLLAGLRGQLPPAPFAAPEAVRRRGRQRAHRQAVSAGVAVLAVTGLGAGGLVTVTGGPGPEPPASPAPPAVTSTGPAVPTPTPAPTGSLVPDRWLLAAADLSGSGSGWERTGNELLEGEWYWDGAEPWCPQYRIEDYPSVRQRLDLRTVSWARPGGAMPERVDQIVARFPPGVGAANVADVRRYVATCSRRPAEGDQAAPIWYDTVATGFAGDESLLLRVEPYHFNQEGRIEPVGEFHQVAVVRVGDAVTTIVYQAAGDVRDLAERAAARLR